MPEQKPKRTRSRFGCNNCKKMKIKCDELKPQCTNCLKSKKYHNQCDYTIKLSWGGRPYKNKQRKQAMQNCGYTFDDPTSSNLSRMVPSSLEAHFVSEFQSRARPRRTTAATSSGGSSSSRPKRTNIKFSFIDENSQVSREYLVGGTLRSANTAKSAATKATPASAVSASAAPSKRPAQPDYDTNFVNPTSLSINPAQSDDPEFEAYVLHLAPALSFKKRRVSEDFPVSLAVLSTDSESSVASNLDLGSFRSSNSVTSAGSVGAACDRPNKLTNGNVALVLGSALLAPPSAISDEDSDSAIDAFRYDNSNFLERLRKAETYEGKADRPDEGTGTHGSHTETSALVPFLLNSLRNTASMADNDQLRKLVEFYDLTQSNMTKMGKGSPLSGDEGLAPLGSLNAFEHTDSNNNNNNNNMSPLFVPQSAKEMDVEMLDTGLQTNNNLFEVPHETSTLFEKVKPGLASLVICLRQKVCKAMPMFSEATVESVMQNFRYPCLKQETLSAKQFMPKSETKAVPENLSSSQDAGYYKTFTIGSEMENLGGMENFYTEVNYNDFFGLDGNSAEFGTSVSLKDFDTSAEKQDDQQISLPFAETDDFWASFTNIANDEESWDDAELDNFQQSPGLFAKDNSNYASAYSVSPPGVLLLNKNIQVHQYQGDIDAVYDKANFASFYSCSRFLDARVSVALVPLPDMLMNVSYYRELFHFYIHCASDSMVNYKDEFCTKLMNATAAGHGPVIEKNPFKYQLPAIAFQSEAIMAMILSISAAFRQFKTNFENLTFEDVGKLRTSSRSMASLNISKSSLSRYNYHKNLIQNLLSRSFYHMIDNLEKDVNTEECIILIYLINYLERITCKRLSWKLVDYEQDMVFTAMELNLPELLSDSSPFSLQSIIRSRKLLCTSSASDPRYQLDEFLTYMIYWSATMAIISGCLVKSPNVNRENIYKEDLDKVLTTNCFDFDDNPMESSNNDEKGPKHKYIFGLDTRLLGELYKVMQLTKEKWYLINKFKDSKNNSALEFGDLFNINTGLIGTALNLKNTLISKFSETIKDLDTRITDEDENVKKVLKVTNKLYVYASLLILYRRVIMVPRDSDIAQRFSKEILRLANELNDLSDVIYGDGKGAGNKLLTLFNGCLSFSVVCGALETLDFKLKKKALLKIFQNSKKNFSLNSFLSFEIIQESYENCLPLSEIINKRQFRVYFS